MIAGWALPLSPKIGARQHLLWGLLILAVIPELSYVRGYSSEGVVAADLPVAAVWALSALRSAGHPCSPDVWLPGWTFVAVPDSINFGMRLDLNCTQVKVFNYTPLFLHLWAQQADIR